MAEPMRALSVRYPWSYCIAKRFKPVENRTRPIPDINAAINILRFGLDLQAQAA